MSKPNKKPGQRDDARQETKSNAFDDVSALIKERRKYVDWIAAIEAKKDITPAHVYERVHSDYETRLDAVVAKLNAHRDALTKQQDGLRDRIAEIDEEMQLHQESRAETELRAHVGELTAAALTEALRIVDTELDRLSAQRHRVETELARIDEFFAATDGTSAVESTTSKRRKLTGFDELSFLHSVVGAPKPTNSGEMPAKKPGNSGEMPARTPGNSGEMPARTAGHSGEMVAKTAPTRPALESPPPARPVEVPSTPPEIPSPKPAPAPSPRPTPGPQPKPVEPSPAPTPAPAPSPAPPEVPQPRASVEKPAAEAAVQGDGFVEKAVELTSNPAPVSRPSIAMQMASLTIDPDTVPSPARDTLGIIKTGEQLPPSLLEDLKPQGESKDKPFAANVASNNPLSLKATAGGELKTLKCRECGSMNDPSEWYCERCGAELSAI